MAMIKKSQFKEMSVEQLKTKVPEFQNELLAEKVAKTTAGKPSNPGRMRSLKKAIARIKTLLTKKGSTYVEPVLSKVNSKKHNLKTKKQVKPIKANKNKAKKA